MLFPEIPVDQILDKEELEGAPHDWATWGTLLCGSGPQGNLGKQEGLERGARGQEDCLGAGLVGGGQAPHWCKGWGWQGGPTAVPGACPVSVCGPLLCLSVPCAPSPAPAWTLPALDSP